MFTRVYQTLRDTGTLSGVRIAAVGDVNDGLSESTVQMVQSSPRASRRRVARRLRVPHTSVENTVCRLHVYQVRRVLHLGPGDFPHRLEFCKWLNGSRQLHRYTLFTDEAQFNRNGVNNTHNSHVWEDENPHATVESNFQLYFSVKVWCAVLDDQLIGPFILKGRLTGEAYLRFLQEKFSQILEDVPLNKRGRMYFQHDGVPHSPREVTNFLNYRFPRQWIGSGSPFN